MPLITFGFNEAFIWSEPLPIFPGQDVASLCCHVFWTLPIMTLLHRLPAAAALSL